MATFNLRIELDTAAFAEAPEQEVARILTGLVTEIRDDERVFGSGDLYDAENHAVGGYYLDENAPQACIAEFGPHEAHGDCQDLLDLMRQAPFDPDGRGDDVGTGHYPVPQL